ncbi:hypothetical protein GCM10010492_55900 [Saccharothrix mutabilis subsp. mutabilis]|uniref:HTH merR-type domain-containing protein n=1 Tax=Saccharothrix mutabilis subsp. mutabilis TaxID=66855 RepID=A0ABP3E3K8_9PSEU
MNAGEFSAKIGLSARTIRSYHARGLLPPPVRIGRTPHYLDDHLTRMRQVLWLQRRGLSLDAVGALLEPDATLGQVVPVGPAVAEALRGKPDLLAAGVESGIISQHPDGTVEVHAVRAVFAAGGRGTSVAHALGLLAEMADAVAPHVDKAVEAVRRSTACANLAKPTVPDDLADLVLEVVRARIRRTLGCTTPTRDN